MYRSAARRFLPALCRPRNNPDIYTRTITILKNTPRFYTTAYSETISDQNPLHFQSTASSKAFNEEVKTHGQYQEIPGTRTARPGKVNYQEEQARVLQAALHHVPRVGWNESAMIAGAREVGVSPSVVGSFPRKDAALVEFFMDDCLERLIEVIESREDLKDLTPSARVAKLVRIRLEMQVPHISKWPQVLSIQAQPANIPTSFKQRAMLIDEIWHATGDESTDLDWYVKRTILGGIYSTTELYMLTDTSPEFHDTWSFLDGRVRDAFDLKKSVQEAKYMAETVSAGMGGSLQGLMKQIFPN